MSEDIGNLEEVKALIKRISKLSKDLTLPWESTAYPNVYMAKITDKLFVKISEVDDFEGGDDPDHILTLVAGQKDLLSMDRMSWDATQFKGEFGEFPALYLKKIYSRAKMKALNVLDRIAEANKALGKIIEDNEL